MFFSRNSKGIWGTAVAAIAVLFVSLPSVVRAQTSPLTVQPSTGRIGVDNTNPGYTLDVSGTVNANAFRGDGSQLTNLPAGSQWTTDGSNIYYNVGNVGVGNTSPGYKLDISGTVNATAFRGDGSQLTNLSSGGASNAIDKVTVNTTILGSNHAETALYSFAVPGGTLGTNNMLRLTIQISTMNIVEGDNFVLRVKYGGTTMASVTYNAGGKGIFNFIIAGDGATNSQIGTFFSYGGSVSVAQGTAATDSTTNQTLSVTVDWANWAGSSGNNVTAAQAILEKVF